MSDRFQERDDPDWNSMDTWNARELTGCIQDSTEYFMHKAGQLEERGFGHFGSDIRQTRRAMLFGSGGEITEFADADLEDDVVEYVDGAIDSMVVLWGTILKAIGPRTAMRCVQAVNETNLSKVDGSLGPIVWAGEPGKSKVLKPEGWAPPNIQGILEADGWEFDANGQVIKEGNYT